MGIIYKLTCPEGKSYIGRTIQTFKKRMSGHVNGKSYCRALKSAIEKFGFDAFHKQIIWEGDNSLISEKEKYYIKEFNTIYPCGYNLSSGGGRGEHRSCETLKLMKEKQRNIAKNRNNGLLGYIVENHSKVDGRITSWTVKNNKQGSLGNFKTKEDAVRFQCDYTKEPDKYITNYRKRRVANSEGGVYKKRNKWIVVLYIDNQSKYYGSFKTKEEAIQKRDTLLHD